MFWNCTEECLCVEFLNIGENFLHFFLNSGLKKDKKDEHFYIESLHVLSVIYMLKARTVFENIHLITVEIVWIYNKNSILRCINPSNLLKKKKKTKMIIYKASKNQQILIYSFINMVLLWSYWNICKA